MKINIPRVVVPVDMSEYAPELAGQYLHVWVNPPLEMLGNHLTLAARASLAPARPHPTPPPTPPHVEENNMERGVSGEDELLKWYVEVWNQGPEPTHWTLEEVRELQAQDPAFLVWMIQATTEARKAHLDRKKKS
jgi:hypothetical protein